MRHFITALEQLQDSLRRARAVFIGLIVAGIITVAVVLVILDKLDE